MLLLLKEAVEARTARQKRAEGSSKKK